MYLIGALSGKATVSIAESWAALVIESSLTDRWWITSMEPILRFILNQASCGWFCPIFYMRSWLHMLLLCRVDPICFTVNGSDRKPFCRRRR